MLVFETQYGLCKQKQSFAKCFCLQTEAFTGGGITVYLFTRQIFLKMTLLNICTIMMVLVKRLKNIPKIGFCVSV